MKHPSYDSLPNIDPNNETKHNWNIQLKSGHVFVSLCKIYHVISEQIHTRHSLIVYNVTGMN